MTILSEMIDKKACIIAIVNLTKEISVHNILAKFKGFFLLINYGTILMMLIINIKILSQKLVSAILK